MSRLWLRTSGNGAGAGAGGGRLAGAGTRVDRVADMDPAIREEAVEFLRSWLPERAKSVYRTMIAEDPECWRAHPHFAGHIIVEHALRGNGITEEALGVTCLEAVWAELLELALTAEGVESEAGAPRPE